MQKPKSKSLMKSPSKKNIPEANGRSTDTEETWWATLALIKLAKQ
jgi:hypothetical protein